MSRLDWQHRPPAQQQRAQALLLQQWVETEVRPFSPWWRERLADRTVGDQRALATLPTLREAEAASAGGPGNPALLLTADEDAFKRSARRADVFAAAAEVGGRGVAGRRAAVFRRYKPVHVHEAGVDRLLAVAYTRTDLDRLHLAGARLAEVLGIGSDDALINLVPAGPSLRFWGLYHMALAVRMTALHPRGAGQAALRAAARALALLPASVLAVPVAEAVDLFTALGAQALGAPELRVVLVVGEPPTTEQRVAVAAAAGLVAGHEVRVQAVWAPEVSRVLYGEAPVASGDPAEATYGLLTYPDLELLEVCDPASGRPVAPGEPGELVITSLGWRGTALLRFATGSWVGGLISDVAHPVTGATVPRLAPEAVDGAWQPKVTAGTVTRRIDLRPAYEVLRPTLLDRLGTRSWALKVLDGKLVLGLDAEVQDTVALTDLAQRLGQAVGVAPEIRLGRRTASLRPQVGDAGPRNAGPHAVTPRTASATTADPAHP